jgi:hypothetical protein
MLAEPVNWAIVVIIGLLVTISILVFGLVIVHKQLTKEKLLRRNLGFNWDNGWGMTTVNDAPPAIGPPTEDTAIPVNNPELPTTVASTSVVTCPPTENKPPAIDNREVPGCFYTVAPSAPIRPPRTGGSRYPVYDPPR